ncbi:MAG: SDR family oxidoreductase [Pseudomonadota bacterium]
MPSWQADPRRLNTDFFNYSAIAEATARLWTNRGATFFLVARQLPRLQALADDLNVRGATASSCFVMDACDRTAHAEMLKCALEKLGAIDIALIAHGVLPEQKACAESVELTLEAIDQNGLSVIALATRLANILEKQAHGSLAVISSVAGDRGRQSNYVYGSAKAMVSVFLQGLRARLHKKGVQVLTIKPGFVDTPMTASFKKSALWAQPEAIASGIVDALEQERDEVYLPSFWRLIMCVIRHIPERIFKRLSL